MDAKRGDPQLSLVRSLARSGSGVLVGVFGERAPGEDNPPGEGLSGLTKPANTLQHPAQAGDYTQTAADCWLWLAGRVCTQNPHAMHRIRISDSARIDPAPLINAQPESRPAQMRTAASQKNPPPLIKISNFK